MIKQNFHNERTYPLFQTPFISNKRLYALSILRLKCLNDTNKDYLRDNRNYSYVDRDENEYRYSTLLYHQIKKRIDGIAVEKTDMTSRLYEHMIFTIIDRKIVESLDFRGERINKNKFLRHFLTTAKKMKIDKNCIKIAYIVSAEQTHWNQLMQDIEVNLIPYTLDIDEIGRKRRSDERKIKDIEIAELRKKTYEEHTSALIALAKLKEKIDLMNK
jgi:hypothetical protein